MSKLLNMTEEMHVIRDSVRLLSQTLDGLRESFNPYDVIDSIKVFECRVVDSLLWAEQQKLSLYCIPKSNGVVLSGHRKDESGQNNRYWDNEKRLSKDDRLLYLRLFSFEPMSDFGSHVLVAQAGGTDSLIIESSVGLVDFDSVDFLGVPGDGLISNGDLPACCK